MRRYLGHVTFSIRLVSYEAARTIGSVIILLTSRVIINFISNLRKSFVL